MADRDQGLAGLAFTVGCVDQQFVNFGDTLEVVIAKVGPGDFGRAQKRQGEAPGGRLAAGVG
ncbi:hypothetical protein D3C76_1564530 [compost metagenome]